MHKFKKSDLPDLSDLPTLSHRRPKKRHWFRWIVLLGVAFAALAWKQRSVKAPGNKSNQNRTDNPVADVSTWKSELESENASETNDSFGTGSPDSSSQESTANHSGESAEALSDAGVPPTIEAGVDEEGVFRPTRVESDAFGVVVTDPAPVGLNGDVRWVASDGAAECPEAFPIKGNASSRIYHQPGESSYEKTIPEFCFATAEDAKAAGYRPRAR